LALHLARHGLIPFGTRIEIQQGVEMGRVDGTAEQVDLMEVAGSAIVVARGVFLS
jgi:trans-2,3-dihydro-3-hydroxyanthranilate isomerase